MKEFKKYINKKYIMMMILCACLFLSIVLNIILINKIYRSDDLIDENIVFFGDSITELYNVEEFFPNTYVVNSGISGDQTTDLIDRIYDDVYKYNPTKVFLMIGTNDLNHDVSKAEILKNIQKIINGIKTNRKNTEIYVESIYPINRDALEENEYEWNENITNDIIIELNDELKKLCIENDVHYIDIFTKLLDEDGNLKSVYTLEGLHLNDLGYFKVTTELQKYISKKNKQC